MSWKEQVTLQLGYPGKPYAAALRICHGSQDLVRSMGQFLWDDAKIDDLRDFLPSEANSQATWREELRADVENIDDHVDVIACEQESQLFLRELLHAEGENLTNVLCVAASFFDVSRKRVRRYVSSCEHAALHNGKEELPSGIFAPGVYAEIMKALVQHTELNDDTSLAMLRETLPPAICH